VTAVGHQGPRDTDQRRRRSSARRALLLDASGSHVGPAAASVRRAAVWSRLPRGRRSGSHTDCRRGPAIRFSLAGVQRLRWSDPLLFKRLLGAAGCVGGLGSR
jgi:hypothetical protein